jgi:hypothetical protein
MDCSVWDTFVFNFLHASRLKSSRRLVRLVELCLHGRIWNLSIFHVRSYLFDVLYLQFVLFFCPFIFFSLHFMKSYVVLYTRVLARGFPGSVFNHSRQKKNIQSCTGSACFFKTCGSDDGATAKEKNISTCNHTTNNRLFVLKYGLIKRVLNVCEYNKICFFTSIFLR